MFDNLILQLQRIFSSYAGILVYHLVISLCVAGSLQFGLLQRTDKYRQELKRLILGLSILLLTRMGLFLLSGLVWQGVIPEDTFLPVTDRAITLLSYIVLLWLWVFPRPSRFGDFASLIISAIVIAGTIAGVTTIAETGNEQSQWFITIDYVAQISTLTFLLIGLFMLSIRQSEAWFQGVVMFVLLGIGHGLYLFTSSVYEHFPVMIRLFQLIAYPFLFTLPGRFAQLSSGEHVKSQAHMPGEGLDSQEAFAIDNPDFWKTIQRMISAHSGERLCYFVSSALAYFSGADICLLVFKRGETLEISCGSDVVRKIQLGEKQFQLGGIPLIASSYRLGRTRKISDNSMSPDLNYLAEVLNLERTGNTLFIPIVSSKAKTEEGILLLSPYSQVDWSSEQQSLIRSMARLLVYFLHRSMDVISLQKELEQISQSAAEAEKQLEIFGTEQNDLYAQIASEELHTESKSSRFEPVESDGDSSKNITTAIEDKTETKEIPDLSDKSPSLDGDLRIALEEIAYLRDALSSSEKKMHDLRKSMTSDSAVSIETLAKNSIVNELRQNLTSIIGHTDVLLEERYGILGKRQKRSLQRIRLSADRMTRTLDELNVTSGIMDSEHELKLADINLGSLVSQVTKETQPAGEIFPRISLELLQEPVIIRAEENAMKQIIRTLLQNALQTSNPDGEVIVRLQLDIDDFGDDYAILQFEDQGNGILAEHLALILSSRIKETEIDGLGIDVPTLMKTKKLVESFNGRIWVDSELGKGSIVSAIFPVVAFSDTQI